MAGGKFTEKTRDLIKQRAKGRCELCGTPLPTAAQIHHRRPRGMGGTTTEESRSPANGLWLHFRCHERVERNREHAVEMGWLVPQAHDPAEVPVFLAVGWVLLSPEGTYLPSPSCSIASDGNELVKVRSYYIAYAFRN